MAEGHLEKALRKDPLDLSTAALLMDVYMKRGETDKAQELAKRIGADMQ